MERFLTALALVTLIASVAGSSAWFLRGNLENALDSAVLASLASARSIANALQNRAEPEQYSILLVGDVMLDRGVAWKIEKSGGGDPRFPFLKSASVLEAADVAFGNLEGPISNRGSRQGSDYSFRMDPAVVSGLVFAGFDVLSLANNHIWDYGRGGLEDTLVLLERAAIQPVGAGRDRNAANAPAILRLGDTRIGFLAFTTTYPKGLEAKDGVPGISTTDRLEMQNLVRTAQSGADVVIVSMHWGVEYETRARDAERELGRALIDAGADLIVGHHPHVAQEVERYDPPSHGASDGRGGWIAFSLGNFIFDQDFSDETRKGLVLQVTVQNGTIVAMEERAIRANAEFQPEFVLEEP